ncbi:MAG: hypothetical protein Q9172_007712 [Xanthocarpia lactea]
MEDLRGSRQRLLEAVFGPQVVDHNLYRGLQMFVDYTEHSLSGLNAQRYRHDSLNTGQQITQEPPPEDLLETVLLLIECLKELQEPRTSIDNALDRVFAKTGVTSDVSKNMQPIARQDMFAVIGICSMIYQPASFSQSTPASIFRLVQTDPSRYSTISTDVCRRPLFALLREFEMMRDPHSQLGYPNGEGGTSGNHNDALTSSNLSFSALKESCRIEIEWTMSLDAHLIFNTDSKTLHLFRFPSYCAAAHLNGSDSFLASMMAKDSSALNQGGPKAECLSREILLSYRLLFAQDRKSRRLFSRLRNDLRMQSWYDPFFEDLCTAKLETLETRYKGFRGKLDPEGSVFYASEFRFLGKRLLKLQQFGERHRPRKLMEFYRDKRDSEKYFTFWAVIWIGGASIVLSIMQLLLGAAQVAIAHKQLTSGSR